jgi:hypothetical protein
MSGQPIGSVRLSSFEELEAWLIEMEAIYAAATTSQDRVRVKECRRAVINAKYRARLAARNPKVDPEKRKQKEEMAEWLLVWLENPGIFESWAALRKQAKACPKEPG